MAVLQDQGRIALAQALMAQPIYLAWGRGLPAWDAAPVSEPVNATALVDEIGRRIASAKRYVTPQTDPNPAAPYDIKTPGGDKYLYSADPTSCLLLEFQFDYNDAATEVIRELGVLVGSETIAGLPAGQRYFTPAQIKTQGRLYMLDRIPKLIRTNTTEPLYRYVLPF